MYLLLLLLCKQVTGYRQMSFQVILDKMLSINVGYQVAKIFVLNLRMATWFVHPVFLIYIQMSVLKLVMRFRTEGCRPKK